MDLEDELRLLSMLAGACLLLFPAALQAQTVWDMPTEYPQNAMPGVGLTPLPPSGIWSKTPLTSPPDLAGLSIRTYDRTSTEVFLNAGAKAASISFADTMPKLLDGSINAVLSSGDGGAGRKLWEYLPCFSEITYSLPLSIASANQVAYDGLSPDTRAAVDAASRQTESDLWLVLSTRLEVNYRRMRQTGLTH